jgi:hypothetical protein
MKIILQSWKHDSNETLHRLDQDSDGEDNNTTSASSINPKQVDEKLSEKNYIY